MHQTENCHRNHNERGKLGYQGNTGCARTMHGLLRNQGGGDDGHLVFAKKRPRAKHRRARLPGSVGRNQTPECQAGDAHAVRARQTEAGTCGAAASRVLGAPPTALLGSSQDWFHGRTTGLISACHHGATESTALITVPETQAWPPPPCEACLQIKAPPPQAPEACFSGLPPRPLIWQHPGIPV